MHLPKRFCFTYVFILVLLIKEQEKTILQPLLCYHHQTHRTFRDLFQDLQKDLLAKEKLLNQQIFTEMTEILHYLSTFQENYMVA